MAVRCRTIRYPGDTDSDTRIYYAKAGVSDAAPLSIRAFKVSHPQFPHDPTVSQLYSYEQLEAYREVGRWVAGQLLALSSA